MGGKIKNQMENVVVAVLWPIGPSCKVAHIKDTYDSIRFYLGHSRRVVIVDDSGDDRVRSAISPTDDVSILKTAGKQGKGYGLYITLSQGLVFITKNVSCDVILRMDTDALVVNTAPEMLAFRHFQDNPFDGIIGSHKISSNGGVRDWAAVANVIEYFIAPHRWIMQRRLLKKAIRRPERIIHSLLVKRWVLTAKSQGYELGEHCMGGAYFMNPRLVSKLYEQGLLGRREFKWVGLEEDMIFGLLAYVAGFRLNDFATEGFPMGLKHIGLPAAPPELILQGKSVIHSTRSYSGWTESEVRRFFRDRRVEDQHHP